MGPYSEYLVPIGYLNNKLREKVKAFVDLTIFLLANGLCWKAETWQQCSAYSYSFVSYLLTSTVQELSIYITIRFF